LYSRVYFVLVTDLSTQESGVIVSYLKETPTPGPICLVWTFV